MWNPLKKKVVVAEPEVIQPKKPVAKPRAERVKKGLSSREQAEALLISQYGPFIRKNCAEKWDEMVTDVAKQLDSHK